jgi:hypothetical protein
VRQSLILKCLLPNSRSIFSYISNGCSLGGTTIAACIGTSTGPSTKSVITTALIGTELASQFKAVILTDNLPVSTTRAAT